jgi:hypothetical protein
VCNAKAENEIWRSEADHLRNAERYLLVVLANVDLNATDEGRGEVIQCRRDNATNESCHTVKEWRQYNRKNPKNWGWRSDLLLRSDGSNDETKHREDDTYHEAESAVKHAEHFAERKRIDSFD